MNRLQVLINRLEKINIKIECTSNYPWIYLSKINGKAVKENYDSEHGFVIAMLSPRNSSYCRITNITEIFKIIRKYTK